MRVGRCIALQISISPSWNHLQKHYGILPCFRASVLPCLICAAAGFGCMRPMWKVAEVDQVRTFQRLWLVPSRLARSPTTPPSPTKQEQVRKKKLSSAEQCYVRRHMKQNKSAHRKLIAPNSARRQAPRAAAAAGLYVSGSTLRGPLVHSPACICSRYESIEVRLQAVH